MYHPLHHPDNPLVRFVYLRTFGFVTGSLGVAAALLDHGAPMALVAAMFASCWAWPWIARRRVLVAPRPLRREQQNLVLDTGLAGFWVAQAGFDLVPTAMFIALMGMDRMVEGGWKLAGRAMASMAAMAVLGWSLAGFPFTPHSSLATIAWCLPFLVLYPLGLGWVAWLISERQRQRKRELEQDSLVDFQTGLATRRRWEDEVARQIRRFHSYATPATVMMLDIDHFKQINDAAGHVAGDEVLAEVARCISAHLGPAGMAGRYGGDEFGIVLPGTGLALAREMAERLRRAVTDAVSVQGRPVGMSIGLAELGPGLDTAKAWTAAADAALYRAKLDGRGCVRD